MKKKSVKKPVTKKYAGASRVHPKPIRWLPIHGKYIPSVFHCNSVTGVSRLFLEIEITLAFLIVVGTIFAIGMKMFF